MDNQRNTDATTEFKKDLRVELTKLLKRVSVLKGLVHVANKETLTVKEPTS